VKTEKVFVCLFVISLILKMYHVPGEAVLLTFTLMGLAVLYSILGFYFFSYKGLRNQKWLVSILSGILLSVGLCGILFRLQFWPGSAFLGFSGTMLSLIILVILIVLSGLKNNKTERVDDLKMYYSNMIIRSAVIFTLCSALYITPTRTLVYIECWNDTKLAELKINYLQNKEDRQAYQAYTEYLKKR
jgi:hypothetical protein